MEEYVTMKEARERLGVTRDRLWRYVRDNKIPQKTQQADRRKKYVSWEAVKDMKELEA